MDDDEIEYEPMDDQDYDRLLGLANMFNDNNQWLLDFTELEELSALLTKFKGHVDAAISNAPAGAKDR